MNTQLPAYLQGKPQRETRIAEAAALGLGGSLPPHISIRGNAFTLIDAANTENSIGAVMDCVIVDVCDVVAKMYYGGKKWEPDSNDPPVCFSSNGLAPSTEALEPQARTCAECPNNVRGSAVSAMSGAAIKACRDEKLLAILPIQFPGMMFQMKITPGSFTNWRDYLKKFEGQQFDLNDVVTRIAFQPKVNGVLTFAGVAHLADPAIIQARNNALIEKKTDLLVGRLDKPRDPALALPGSSASGGRGHAHLAAPAEPAHQEQPAGTFGATAVDSAPVDAGARARHSRKPKAEQQPNGPVAGQAAPFMESAPPPVHPPAAGQGGFGIQPGVAPNPELTAALDSVFGTPARSG